MITHIGQRVQVRHAPEHKGTVSRLTSSQITVVFDWPQNRPGRRKGERRERYSYPASYADNFVPETFEEIRVLEGEEDEAG
jgi:hypothetical protein